tara:strand:- start:7733 stop:9010 length:1278 start_codon:yes stop_codon:yes gene_type:complete
MSYIIDYLIYKYAGILEDLQEKYPSIKDKISEYQSKVEIKYLRWLANRLQARFDNLESFNDQDITSTLSLFDKYKGNEPIQSNLYNYLTFKELENDIKVYLKFKNKKPLRKNTGTLTEIYKDDEYILVRPDDKQACIAFRDDTDWCITSASSLYYEEDSVSNVVFYFLLTDLKEPYAKIAFSVQRDLSNNISKIQVWDSQNTELSNLLGILPDEDYMKILNIVKADAVIAPEGIVVKINNGTAELNDVVKYVEFLEKNNVDITDFIINNVNHKYYDGLRVNGYKCPYYNDNGLYHREDGPAIEGVDGSKAWYINGIRHRDDGPAIEWYDGSKEWYLNGEWHREGGPAYEAANGDKYWYINGKLHREDGPAYEGSNGTKKWYLNGKVHREDGPAIEWFDGHKEWYYHGKKIDCKDNQQFLRMIRDL